MKINESAMDTSSSINNVQEKDIAILIPTMNRSHFLIRALSYYKKMSFKGYICIGDSSTVEEMNKNLEAIRNVASELNILYCFFPNPPYLNDSHCMQRLIEIAPARFLVYSGDDDLLVPSGLVKCASFLADNPEYSAAHGIRICTRLNKKGAYGEIDDVYFVPEHILESDIASHRLAGYIYSSNSTQYYVHRKDTWIRMYSRVSSIKTRYIGPELLPCCLSAILGKIKFIDTLTTVFQFQDERPFSWDTTSLYSLMLSQEWLSSIASLRGDLAEALSVADNLSSEEAQETIDKLLLIHFTSMLSWQYIKTYPNYQDEQIPCLLDFTKASEMSVEMLFGTGWLNLMAYLKNIARKEFYLIGSKESESFYDQVIWYNVYEIYKYFSEKANMSQDHEIYSIKEELTKLYGDLTSIDNPIIQELKMISLMSYQLKTL